MVSRAEFEPATTALKVPYGHWCGVVPGSVFNAFRTVRWSWPMPRAGSLATILFT
jgi:hypothetical protein